MSGSESGKSTPLSRWWEGLPPQTKRVMIAVGAVLMVGTVMVTYQGMLSAQNAAALQRTEEAQVGDILLTTDPRQLGIQTINRDVDELKRTIAEQGQRIDDVATRMERFMEDFSAQQGAQIDTTEGAGGEQTSSVPEASGPIEAGGVGITPLNRTDAAVAEFRRNNPAANNMDPPSQPSLAEPPATGPAPPVAPPAPAEIFVIDASGRRGARAADGGVATAPPSPPSAAQEVQSRAEADTKPAANSGNYLPAGSFLTGVLLTGADVPTGRGTQSQPVPVFVRVKLETILPNRFTSDLAECHVVAAAVGDLSSERVLLRSDLLSCVREDGGVLEVPVQMSASGPDGKAGVRGTLVSREGQFLGRALLAGFADGVGRAFAPQRVPVFQSDGEGFVTPPVSDSLQYGAAEGIGSAMQRLADYYMDRADQMFPVIELSAGTEVTFGVLSGRALVNLDATQ